MKQQQETVTQDRIPPFMIAARNLVIKNQAKADLITAHFNFKMATEEPERQPPYLNPLYNLPLDNIVVAEDVVARYLCTITTRKAPGPDGVSPFLLKHCAWEGAVEAFRSYLPAVPQIQTDLSPYLNIICRFINVATNPRIQLIYIDNEK